MIKTVALFALSSLLVINQSNAHAHSKANTCNFIPKNNLSIPAGLELMSGIDEASFNAVISKIEAVYRPLVQAQGAQLVMNRLWSSKDVVVHQGGGSENGDTVNANAERDATGKKWIVNMFGGLARYTGMTKDGFAMVLCHELGHHFGGYPERLQSGKASWASNEGQSDYYAAMKCFRRVFERSDNGAAVNALSVPALVKTKCSTTFKSSDEINLCIRASIAGNDLAMVLFNLNGAKTAKPSFSTPDSKQVAKTFDAHPAAQCRLDTYFAGAICGISYQQDFGKNDAVTGACASERGDQIGVRPLCWYKSN